MKRLSSAFFAAIVDRPWITLLAFIAIGGALGSQAPRFEIDASAETLLTKNNRFYVETLVANRRFSPQEFLLIAYEPKRHETLSEETFADLRQISAELRQLERVQSVTSILNVPLLSYLQGGVSSPVNPADLTIEKQGFPIEELPRAFAGHPIYEDLLINKAQTATAIQVSFKRDADLEALDARIVEIQQRALRGELSDGDARELERLQDEAEPARKRVNSAREEEIERIRAIVAPFEERANIYLGGAQVLAYQLIEIINRDLVVFGAAIGVVICVVLLIVFRQLRWVAIPALCCAFSVLPTMGLLGLLELKATVISSNFIALQLILTLAIVIHLIVQYGEYQAEHPDWDHKTVIRKTLERKAGPCFYAGATTCVGFGSLLFSGLQPVIAFGYMMIVALTISTVVSLILFPAVVALAGERRSRPSQGLATATLGFFERATLRRPGWIAAISAAALAASAFGILLLDVENSFINYFDKSTRVHRELAFIDQQFGGSTPLDIIVELPSNEGDGDLALTANTVQSLQLIHEKLAAREAIGKTLSLFNFTQLAMQANQGRPLTEYELTALYQTLDEGLRDDLLGSFFAPAEGQARISIRIKDTTVDLDRADLMDGLHADMRELGVEPARYQLTNLFVLYQDILQRLFRSQILTMGFVFGALSLAFLAIFRSLKIALIALAPNLLAVAVVLGLMGWLDIELDLMTITIAAIAMGIAVDDTIHYIHRYREELKDGKTPAEAVSRSHESVGYAMLYTSIVIMAGFSVLSFSDFVPSALFGQLTALALAAALLGSVTLLPALLKAFVRR